MSPLARGRIVWVELPDPQGRNPKVRPAVVLTPTADIRPDGTVLVAAVTSTTGQAPPEMVVPLPWHADGHPRTKLRVPSEVVCTWLERVAVGSVQRVGGVVPLDRLAAIIEKIGEADPTPPPSPSPPEEA